MKSNLVKIGKFIREVDQRNENSKVTLLRGVSTRKVLIESVANMSGVSLHNYKIAKKGQFVYVADTSRRAEKIAIALNVEETCIVSSIYTVFETDENYLLPEFLFIWFNRSEFDRFTRFHSWGSARETFNWDDMCNVEIPIPHIDEQRKYVALYKGILANQKAYESSLNDLQLICDTYIEDLIKNEPPKVLGEYIEQSELKNTDLKIDNLLGISVNKVFMPSKANQSGLNLANYKVVKEREFGYVSVTSRNGEKISIALLEGKSGVVSSTYTVFKVKDFHKLLPEYLFLFFKRPEFDRYARFHSWGSARETFDWNDMCEVKLPIPDIKIQKAIVTIYHTLETRKRINEQLKASVKPICPILMRGVVQNELMANAN